MMKWVCNLCYPNAIEIGEVAGGYWLMLNDEKYSILGGQGHGGDEFITFKTKPYPAVVPFDISDEEMDRLLELYDKEDDVWIEEANNAFESKFALEDAYHFVKNCVEAGFKDMGIDYWLYDKCGKLIEEYEKSHE